MTSKKKHVHQCFILADANSRIGTGHIMRTFILAKKLVKLNFDVVYLLSETSDTIKDWIQERGIKHFTLSPNVRNSAVDLIDFLTPLKIGRQLLLFDSDEPAFYKIDYQKKLRENGIGLTMITLRNHLFDLDILHNQNPLAFENNYKINGDAKQLLGLKYLIVKNQYQELYEASKTKKIKSIKTLLLTFGGADSKRLTTRVIEVLNQLPDSYCFNVNVIVGALNKDLEQIKQITKVTQHSYTIYHNTPEMPRLMFESDLSISSGGLTVWELAICKTINFLIPTSDREIMSSEYLKKEELIYQKGNCEEIRDREIAETLIKIVDNPKVAAEMCERFHHLVNPFGADLLVKEISDWFKK